MKDYNNAFLGIILAGVLMLVIGLSLLIRPNLVVGIKASATTSEPPTKGVALNHLHDLRNSFNVRALIASTRERR